MGASHNQAETSFFGTLFSFLLVVFCSAGMSFVSVRTYVLFGSYTGLTDHFNTIGVIFLIFWLVIISLGLRLLHPFLGLSPANFALVYAALMVATVLPSMGFGGYFLPLIAGVFYYATPENNWQDLIWPHIPDWAAPRDLEAIRQLFEGMGPDQPIPWGLWAEPLLWWGLFIFSFYLVSVSFISLIHQQWSQQERLVYPLAVVPTLLLDSLGAPAQSMLKSKLLWCGFVLAWLLPTVNMLDRVFDFEFIHGFGIPGFTVEIRRLGVSYGLNTDLLVVGLSYLVNLNVLLSVWLFHLLIALENGALNFFGIVAALPAQPHAPANVLLAHQQIGSLLFIVASSLWIGRHFLKRQWQRVVGRSQGDEPNLVRARWAAVLGAIGLVYMAGFIWATGLALGWALLFLGVSLAVFFGTARLLAQTGVGRLRAAVSIPPLLTNIAGTGNIGGQGLTAMGLSFVWTADIQLFLMGTLAHAFKVCEDVRLKLSGRKILFFLTTAMVVGLVTTVVCYIWLGYRHGLLHGYSWYFVASPQYHWAWVSNSINNPNEPQFLPGLFMALGAGLAALMSLASYRLANWPLHPVGLAIALTNTVRIDWFGMFLAWLVKLIVIRYGGVGLYRKVLPFFIGLILGTCVGVGGAALVYAFYFI
ncbi:MAG: hypothetical protein GKR89_24990 [Candidatus Latescibacteria bacterium]|nr:hypothetical protein [Candidatus Latescibacterota bacterium]